MSVRRSIVVMFILVVALPVIVFGARARNAANTNAVAQNAALQTLTVGRGSVELTVTAIGTIQADQSVSLSFSGAGRVTEILVNAGDVVRAGDVIARQVNTTQQIALDQALLALDLATIQRDQLLEGADAGQIAIAQANVDAAEAALYSISTAVSADDIRAAELAYQAAQQALADAVQARSTAAGGQPQEAYALLDARVGEATFNAETARLQLESLQGSNSGQVGAAAARLEQARRDLERLQAGPTQAEIDRAEALIAQAQLNVQQAQTALDRTTLTAPFDGVISTVNVEVGTLAAPGLAVVNMLDTDPLRLNVDVDEIDIRQIREGMNARVRLDALPEVQFPAVIERIALISNNEGGIVSYDVQLRLEQINDPRVRVGMTAEAAVVVDARDDVLVVPNLYIRIDRRTGKAFVNLVGENNMLEEVEVTLGLQGEDNSEILSGVREGDVLGVDLSGDSINIFGG